MVSLRALAGLFLRAGNLTFGGGDAITAVLQKQADAVSDDISTLNLAADKNKDLRVLTPLTREPSGVMVRLGDQKFRESQSRALPAGESFDRLFPGLAAQADADG